MLRRPLELKAPPLVETEPWRCTDAPEPVAAQKAESDGPSRYLGETDRIHIADRLRKKASVRAIAAELGRSPSTISREIRRNRMRPTGERSGGGLGRKSGRSARTRSSGTSSSIT